jgi:hypothetical protein
MGKLHKKIKKYSPMAQIEQKVLGKDTYDQLHPLGTQAESAYDAKVESEQALKDVEAEPVIPMADEEEIERARRRRSARRGGGRASTVLSDDNRLGG